MYISESFIKVLEIAPIMQPRNNIAKNTIENIAMITKQISFQLNTNIKNCNTNKGANKATCRMAAYKAAIVKLRGSLSRCATTKSPENCRTRLTSAIQKYTANITKEQGNMQKATVKPATRKGTTPNPPVATSKGPVPVA
jgi:hypothetical protein